MDGVPDQRIKDLIDEYGFEQFAGAVIEAIPQTEEAALNPEEANDFSEMLGEFVAGFEDEDSDE